MKKVTMVIGIYSMLSVIPSQSSLEPAAPKPLAAEEKQKIATIKKELKTIKQEIDAEYKLQADVFRTSTPKTVSPVNTLPEQFRISKNLIDDLIILAQNSGNEKLLEYANRLRPFVIKMYNAAEAINNNIEGLIADTEKTEEVRTIISDSIEKLTSLSLDFKNVATNCDQYNTMKNPYKEQAIAIRDYALAMQYICDKIRESARAILRATKPAPAKKPGLLKRIFG